MRFILLSFLFLFSCTLPTPAVPRVYVFRDSTVFLEYYTGASNPIDSSVVLREQIGQFAKTQLGVCYKYCSKDPAGGFDCSGFVNYVFNHFDIAVPRSSVEFTNLGKTISLAKARVGDLILFTGTVPGKKIVGHIGIILSNENGAIRFIHSSSGEVYGVTITLLEDYYMSRFVKVISILK